MSDQAFIFEFVEQEKERLDKFLARQLPDYSRTRIQNLIRDGFVQVNGIVPDKNGLVIEKGTVINLLIPPVEPSTVLPENILLEIIFENKDVMVVNKPAGLVVHPGPGHSTGTLVNAALAHAPEMEGIGGELRPGIVHRLDKETSGLILIAKNDVAHHWLTDQFQSRKVTKAYLALVDGHPPTPQGRIEAPVGRDPVRRQQMAIVPLDKGREAISEYRSLERFTQHELIEVHPITGRTHQIRLHMAFIHCPIVGDTLYGHRHPTLPIDRHFLHAGKITITLPGEKEYRTFEAPLPAELTAILASLERS